MFSPFYRDSKSKYYCLTHNMYYRILYKRRKGIKREEERAFQNKQNK